MPSHPFFTYLILPKPGGKITRKTKERSLRNAPVQPYISYTFTAFGRETGFAP
jgi:hypothetical protein